jgi:hypothetical protein
MGVNGKSFLQIELRVLRHYPGLPVWVLEPMTSILIRDKERRWHEDRAKIAGLEPRNAKGCHSFPRRGQQGSSPRAWPADCSDLLNFKGKMFLLS